MVQWSIRRVLLLWLSLLFNWHVTSDGARTKLLEECKKRLSVAAASSSSPPASSSSSLLSCLLCAGMGTDHQQYREITPVTSTTGNGENKAAFDKIYKEAVWSGAGGGSGVGSDPAFAHGAGLVMQLIIYKYGITSLLDAPCGAAGNSWMKFTANKIHQELPCFKYHGVDVVEEVIQRNRANFTDGFQSWATFSVKDLSVGKKKANSTNVAGASTNRLPGGYELILSRDALQHLPYAAIAGAMATYCASTATYLFVGSYVDDTDKNNDLLTAGGCFSINLLAPPFSFPSPIELYAESGRPILDEKNLPYPRKYLLLYRLSQLCSHPNVTRFISSY